MDSFETYLHCVLEYIIIYRSGLDENSPEIQRIFREMNDLWLQFSENEARLMELLLLRLFEEKSFDYEMVQIIWPRKDKDNESV